MPGRITGSNSTRFPVIVEDPSNSWTQNGAEIPVSDPDINEIDVIPSGLKGLVVVTNELVADSDPSALDVVGQGLVRDLRTKLDAAFLGNTVANGPSGIESLTGVSETTLSFDGSLDVIAEAVSLAENAGAPTVHPDGLPNFSLVANPSDVLALSTAKVSDDSHQPLLGPDATKVTGRSALGVPIFSAPACEQGTAWLIPRDRVFVVLRDDPEVIADTSAFFSSARTAIRAVLRVGIAFPHEAAVVRVAIDGGS
ncbi:phage major capsid protein [Mycolicibacterium alvei]|uniref:phage major capsid protein n=1 Tax=Mycolicibacterium alvei TaxID=67081 RepID=UPI0021F3BA55|nr:phage major capsid protein [Mycolicibacterium alvei]MCV7002812.1 phage major capsid protein [Mycolicibacterium alvei]